MLAGVPVPEAAVLELARLVREAGFKDTAARLEQAWDQETKVLALGMDERDEILRALEDPPDVFTELRGTLLRDRAWRVREGLQQ